MAEVTLSSKYQIVVPIEAREALGLDAGDKLLVVVEGSHLILARKPDSYRKAIRGITTSGRSKTGFPSGYLESERASWE